MLGALTPLAGFDPSTTGRFSGVHRGHSKPLGEGLFELRTGPVRLFYAFRPGRRIVLLDGMLKKRQEIPPGVLKRLRRYQRALETAERQRDRT
jgi:putative component of toxin-antitoxin plasmid stabilization module